MIVSVLALGEPVALFNNQDMHNVVSYQVQQALQAVQQIPADTFLNTPTEDIVSDLSNKYSLTPPTLRIADAYVDGPHEVEIKYPDYGREVRLRGTLLALIIPFDGEGSMLYINPGRWGGAIRANLHNNNIILVVRGENLQPAHVNEQFKVRSDEIEEYLGYQRAMTDEHRQSLPNRLRPEIEARKQKLLDARKMVAGLAFPIRTRADTPKTYVAPLVRKKIVAALPATSAPFEPEPVLEEANYQAILNIVQSMALVMERSPSAFETMGEENLRQHFLVQLNGHFEGAASGETFNFTGKTDILIRVKDRNIFIAECKFWGGEKSFLATITQLLDYLSWRDTKTAVLVFNRNKDFSGVLKTIETSLTSHPNLKHGPKKEGASRFRCTFGNSKDPRREVIVTILAFDVPT
ncbi:hypothetical protein [Bradyrhizobium sp. LTSP885]|uniref:hypothetical protein n=1 Tax=Bradyrhizobium sp. LTSP885 TaxID=1619232 RepID=UPI000AE867AD|nr:hypothetical protein [Bradyrhizobium sp. LTSP885]